MHILNFSVIVFSSAVLLSSCSSVESGVKSNLGETISDKSVLMGKFKQKKGMLDSSALNLACSS